MFHRYIDQFFDYCRLAAFSIRSVIVHYHGVGSQLDHIRLFDPQAPDEQGLQQSPEQKDPRPGKCFEKALNAVGRGHLFFISFGAASSVTRILGQLIKISHMPAGPVDHKAQNLLKEFEDGNALFAQESIRLGINIIANSSQECWIAGFESCQSNSL